MQGPEQEEKIQLTIWVSPWIVEWVKSRSAGNIEGWGNQIEQLLTQYNELLWQLFNLQGWFQVRFPGDDWKPFEIDPNELPWD